MLKTKTAIFKTQVKAACKRIATPALFLCTIVSLEAQATGSVRGKVIDSANGEPMIGVTAVIKELGVYGVTDIDGSYVIPNVPAGKHTVVYQIMGYQTSSTSVNVGAGGAVRANITMNYKVSTEVVVTAKRIDNTSAALLSKRKKAAAAQDAISAEQISKSPDSDAGEAAKRVTGITVVDGKYVYVRGLGERYSSVQYNGSTIPSPNPDKRIVPLDIFPSALLDNLVISKTYTVDMPAEFSGGLVQINSKDYPEERELKISLSTGYNTITTGKTFLASQGGSLDFLGVDDGTRSLPSAIPSESSNRKIILSSVFYPQGFDAAQIEKMGESFARNWDINRSTGKIPGGIQASFGNTYKLSEHSSLGVIAAGLARETSETITDKTYKVYFPSKEVRLDYKQNISNYSTSKGGLLGFTLAPGKHHKLKYNTFYSNNTEDSVQETTGGHPDYLPQLIRDVRIRYQSYSLWFNQISGDHSVGFLDSKFTWKTTYSRADYSQPDYKSYTQLTQTNNTQTLLIREDSPSRVFSKHLDQTTDVQPEWTIPFTQWSGLKSTFMVGGFFSFRDRGSKTRRFTYISNGIAATALNGNINDVISPENISQSNGLVLQETTGQNDSYTGQQIIGAGYGQFDLPLVPSLRLVTGARYEASRIKVVTYDIFAQGQPTNVNLNTNNVAPGANLIYSLTSDINLRAAASLNVSRPDFRELTPFLFLGVAGADVLKGNPELKQAEIANYDLRLEWFPTPSEVLALSGFYKDMKNPIEVIEQPSTDTIITYNNVPKAYVAGIELEIRKSFDFIAKALSDFSVLGNYSYIQSEVNLPAGGFYTNTKRPLQGQSPYVLNAGLSYDHEKLALNVTLLYNVAGRRIIRAGVVGLGDTYEEPVHRIDFVAKKGLGSYGAIKFTAANLLNAEYRATQGDLLRYSYYRGITFGINYDFKF
jgi:hypothetical protein